MTLLTLLQGAAGAAVTSRPSSDITTTGWSASTGADLYAMLDELDADDGDYITSPDLGGSPGPAIFGSAPTQASGSLDVRVRARRTGTSGQIRALLLDAGGATVGTSSWQGLTNSFSLYTLTVTAAGSAAQIKLEVQ